MIHPKNFNWKVVAYFSGQDICILNEAREELLGSYGEQAHCTLTSDSFRETVSDKSLKEAEALAMRDWKPEDGPRPRQSQSKVKTTLFNIYRFELYVLKDHKDTMKPILEFFRRAVSVKPDVLVWADSFLVNEEGLDVPQPYRIRWQKQVDNWEIEWVEAKLTPDFSNIKVIKKEMLNG